jgi:dihydropteroate synthase-like protein
VTHPRLLFVTGRLAETPLRRVLTTLADNAQLQYEVAVLPISVAALMQVDWVLRKLTVPDDAERVIIPGWCGGDLDRLEQRWGKPFVRGPKDLFDLPEFLGQSGRPVPELSEYSIEILAEINHAQRMSDAELLSQAERYRAQGADVIDIGCIPGETWANVGNATRRLRDAGFRVSIDSFNRTEVEAAVEHGAELVLSANASNCEWAAGIPAEFVAIPTEPSDIASLVETATHLQSTGRVVRWDPILEPIGYGFAASLGRFYDVRRGHPDAALMMGIGNLTELSEVDSAGVNFLLAAICEELRVGSILTTEVINWCRTAVQEFDHARRLVRYAVSQRTLPKHLDGRLVLLRDPQLHELGTVGLEELRQRITDPNFRVFAERGEVHVLNRDGYWHGDDPYDVFDRLIADVGSLTPEHAFYLGMELMKARTALTLGKQYTQDEALRWGFLTVDEISAVERRHRAKETQG